MTGEAIRERLFELVEMVLFGRRSVDETARLLAQRPLGQQQLFIAGAEQITGSSIELAYLYCESALPALDQIAAQDWQRWVIHLMDCYESRGAAGASAAMQEVEQFAAMLRDSDCELRFETIRTLLEPFLTGLLGLTGPCARPLKLVCDAEHSYTDTETLHLPPRLSRFSDRDSNFRLYKAMLVHQWAQVRYGSWRVSLSAALQHFDDPERALALFHGLERMRLDGCICRDLPGMGREMALIRLEQGEPTASTAWQAASERLQRTGASVSDSHKLLRALYDQGAAAQPCCYQGEMLPALVEPVLRARRAEDKQGLAQLLRELLDQHRATRVEKGGLDRQGDATQPSIRINRIDAPDDGGAGGADRVELTLDDEAVPLSADAQALLNAIDQDIGDIPEDYLLPVAPGEVGQTRDESEPVSDSIAVADDEERIKYDEWDHQRKQYRKQWCCLQEIEMPPQWDDFVPTTLNKYRGVVKQLRRSFEALRGQERRLRKQTYGDDVDLDAVVESLADQHAGLEASDRVFVRHDRVERDIAVLFMVDMSSSTKGWINQTEREALVLLCESLQTLGDRYAIYGFTSHTHKRCEVLRIKTFDEDYSPLVQARISGIDAREYTRMGAALRHLTGHLQQTGARTRLLITLSDGRPDDRDGYRGSYGIEDTRQAVLEAHAAGIHPFCITIDDQGMDYLPHLFGPNGYAVVSKVERLPFQVSDIYRRLTL